MNSTSSDFEIPAIAESPILDVFPYEGGNLEETAPVEEDFAEEEF